MSVIDLLPSNFRWLEFEEWGGFFIHDPSPEQPNDAEVFYHHSAGSRWADDGIESFQRQQKWYHEVKGYATIAYDIGVHRSLETGVITIGGCRMNWRSAATRDRNEEGEAILIHGFFHPGHRLSETPTADELEGGAFAAAILMERGLARYDARPMGHRDNPAHPDATTCPGDYLYPHIGAMWARAHELIDYAEGNPPEPPKPPTDKHGQYLVRAGDSPWQMAEMFLGGGPRYPELTEINGNVPHPGERWEIPGYRGKWAEVQPGDGSISLLRRELNISNPTKEQKKSLYLWNGGNPYDGERTSYQPGEMLWVDLT
jgi:hypothetical protein